jgi:hypothetical protein
VTRAWKYSDSPKHKSGFFMQNIARCMRASASKLTIGHRTDRVEKTAPAENATHLFG